MLGTFKRKSGPPGVEKARAATWRALRCVKGCWVRADARTRREKKEEEEEAWRSLARGAACDVRRVRCGL